MRNTVSRALLGAAAVLLGGFPALADRFTDAMDPLESEVMDRDAALGEPSDSAGMKTKKALAKVLAELAKDTATLDKDILSASKAGKSALKAYPGDATLLALLVAAANAYAQDATAFREGLEADVLATSPSPAQDKALNALAKAAGTLALNYGETDPLRRLLFLRKGVVQTRAAQNYLANGGGGGGGGGGGSNCGYPYRDLRSGESFSGTYDGNPMGPADYYGNMYSSSGQPRSQATFELWFANCGTTNTGVVIWISPGIGVGTHDVSDAIFEVRVIYIVYSGANIVSAPYGTGTLTLTEADPESGNFAGSFNVTVNGNTLAGSFRGTAAGQ